MLDGEQRPPASHLPVCQCNVPSAPTASSATHAAARAPLSRQRASASSAAPADSAVAAASSSARYPTPGSRSQRSSGGLVHTNRGFGVGWDQ
jgi:hypothetical protein